MLPMLAILPSSVEALPNTAGETLNGKPIVLADAVRGHAAVLVVGFSKEAGDGNGGWARALHADPAFAGIAVYQVAILERAPGFVRGSIKAGLRKGVAPADHDNFVVLVQDEKQWRNYFNVTADKDPYVVLLDAAGRDRWHGHGAARDLEPLLRAAKP
jgi:hypothetical protein